MPSKSGCFAIAAIAFTVIGIACNNSTVEPTKRLTRISTGSSQTKLEPENAPAGMAKATFASGCFWCTEAIFQQLKGVHSVVSGYSGGSVKKPSYDEVCTGSTGHAEAVQVTYDPAVIKYQDLLEVFWKSHDPTTPDRQGYDVGPQYRSVIFYHNDEQKQLAEHYKKKLDDSGIFGKPIVTQVVPFTEFYRAEDYHQNYYNQNTQARYCQLVIGPKLEKLKELFHDKLK
jgi:peptide-methionine (S)-S-oxide reductase